MLASKIKQRCFRRFQLVVLALIRVSGKEAVNAWENHHEFMFGYDHDTWIGDDEIPIGENHHSQVLAGLTFLSNGVMATDEQPMALQKFLETRGSRKTGANSKTSAATKVDRGELASLRAVCPWVEEYLKSTGNTRTTPTVPKQEDDGELEHVVVVAACDGMQATSPCDSGDDVAISIRPVAWTAVFRGADDDRVIAAARKGAPSSWCAQYSL